jgi:hypothetical protein
MELRPLSGTTSPFQREVVPKAAFDLASAALLARLPPILA